MVQEFITFLPGFTCLAWIVLMSLLVSRTRTYPLAVTILAISMFFLLASACHISNGVTPQKLMYITIVRILTGLSLIPTCWLYMKRLLGQRQLQSPQMIWTVIPIAMTSVVVALTILAGSNAIQNTLDNFFLVGDIPDDKILRTYMFVTGPLFLGLILLEFVVYSIKYVQLVRRHNVRLSHMVKFFRGHEVRVAEVQNFNLHVFCILFFSTIAIPRQLMLEYRFIALILAALMTIVVFQFGYISLFSAKAGLSRKDIRRGFRFDYDDNTKAEVQELIISDIIEDADFGTLKRLAGQISSRMPAEEPRPEEKPAEAAPTPDSTAARIFSAVAKSWDDDSLLSRFERLLIGKQLFLESSLTVADLADRLSTNKTYISRLINSTYKMPFPDLVNTLRVDYAERYITEHPDARQSDIARACGFSSASSFNNVFKKLKGVTPKIWLATNQARQQ